MRIIKVERVKGAYPLEINNKQEKGYIEVWLTNEEQALYDRSELTDMLISHFSAPQRCRVVFFLSGQEELYRCAEDLLVKNLGCV